VLLIQTWVNGSAATGRAPFDLSFGNSTIHTVNGIWQRTLHSLLRAAGIKHGYAHRFRDTFSVELLLAGVPIEQVAVALGITEKQFDQLKNALVAQIVYRSGMSVHSNGRDTSSIRVLKTPLGAISTISLVMAAENKQAHRAIGVVILDSQGVPT
jgi:hypothetical protein